MIYIGVVTRAIACAIDAALINLVALVVAGTAALIGSVLPGSDTLNTLAVAAAGALFTLWVVLYFTVFWTTTGQTPGNRLMHIRVMRADGSGLRPRHAVLRMAGVVLSLPFLAGFFPILVDNRRRGLHDFMAGTVVVAAEPVVVAAQPA